MKSHLTFLSLIILFSSCAIHNGTITPNVVNGNIQYLDVAYGVSQTSKVFGIGGLSKDALVMEAKKNLISNNQLKPGEQFANFTLDIKRSWLIIVFNTKVTLTADIVKVNSEINSETYTETYLKKLSTLPTQSELFEVGDTIFYGKKNKTGDIISIESNGNLRIRLKIENGKYKSILKPKTEVFAINKIYRGFKTGDYYVHDTDPVSGDKVGGKIIALGTSKFLFEDVNGKHYKVRYK